MSTKKLFAVFTFLFLCFATQSMLFATQEMDETIVTEKTYVQPFQIHITEEGIFFVNGEGNLEEVSGVFCDNMGTYITKLKNKFQCPFCHRWNDRQVCDNHRCSNYKRYIK